MPYNPISEIVEDIRTGKCVVIIDDESRENEGDIVCAGETITPEVVNFMATEGRGLICTPISEQIAKRFDLHDMVQNNTELHSTRFTVSIDLKQGISTGISCADRAKTIQALASEKTMAEDFARPGHIFPLVADNGGLQKRRGHTEAAIFLTELAGLSPIATICEILNADGSMARAEDLEKFALKHGLKMTSVHELALHEEQIKASTEAGSIV